MYLKNDVGSWITKNINVVVADIAAAAAFNARNNEITHTFILIL